MQSGTKELAAQECGTWEGLSKGGGSGLRPPPFYIAAPSSLPGWGHF